MTTPKLFVHTSKAVKANSAITCCPADRLFLVAEICKGKRKDIYLAYKCRITERGIWHPGFKSLLSISDIMTGKGSRKVCRNGSCPTAEFYVDSFYKEITVEDLKNLINKSAHEGKAKWSK